MLLGENSEVRVQHRGLRATVHISYEKRERGELGAVFCCAELMCGSDLVVWHGGDSSPVHLFCVLCAADVFIAIVSRCLF